MTEIQTVLRQNSPSVESFHSSPVGRTPPPSLQERLESPTPTDGDRLSYLSIHSGSREFLGVVSQSQFLPGNALLPEAGNSENADFSSLSFRMKRREEGYFEDGVHSPRQPQVPRIIPTRKNQNAAAGITRPSDPLTVAPRDAPPVSRTTRRQSDILSQIQHTFPPSPITSAGPPPSLPRQPPPPLPSQVRSESPMPTNDDRRSWWGRWITLTQAGL